MLANNRSKKASSSIYTTQETIENSAYDAFQFGNYVNKNNFHSGTSAKHQVTEEDFEFEIEELPSTPNLEKRYINARGAESVPHLMSSSSTLTSRLHDTSHDAAYTSDGTETLSDILDVEVINTESPVNTEYLIGDIEARMFDERGGVFHSYKHGVTVVFPAGAIPSGILAELKFAATLISPILFASNKTPVSAIYWLCMDSRVRLLKPIKIWLPMIKSDNKPPSLKFAKSLHSKVNVVGDQIKILENGVFNDGEYCGSIEVDHFCYYCIMRNKLDRRCIPSNKYYIIAMMQKHPSSNSWSVHICLTSRLRTCVEYLKNQYNCDWECKELGEFSFEEGYNEMQIELTGKGFRNAARIEHLSDMKIKREDVDFHKYYDNGKLEELKYRMNHRQYPPRCEATVIANPQKSFFTKSSKKIKVRCICNAKCLYKGKISIPCKKIDLYGGDLNEIDSSDEDAKSDTSNHGCISDDSVEALEDEDEMIQGKLQLRNVVLLTSKAADNWYELGVVLCIPFAKMEKFTEKYGGNPRAALNRVYRYWLADKNDQYQPTWEKLISALYTIKEFRIAADVEEYIKPKDDNDSVHIDNSTERVLKNRIMRFVQPDLLDFPTLIPLLNKHHLLTQDDSYDLANQLLSPTRRANLLLYKMLPSKGPGAFLLFLKCLQEEKQHMGHRYLVQLFTQPIKETTV